MISINAIGSAYVSPVANSAITASPLQSPATGIAGSGSISNPVPNTDNSIPGKDATNIFGGGASAFDRLPGQRASNALDDLEAQHQLARSTAELLGAVSDARTVGTLLDVRA